MVLLPEQVGASARESPGTCLSNESGPNRIEQHVTHGSEKVECVQRARVEPRLPEVAGPPLATMEDLGVPSVGRPEGSRKRRWMRRLHDEMNVIRHQTVGEDLEAVAVRRSLQDRLVEEEIRFRVEDGHAPRPTLCHVVRDSRDDVSRSSGHRPDRTASRGALLAPTSREDGAIQIPEELGAVTKEGRRGARCRRPGGGRGG